jgi:hypothetical protein
MNTLCGQSTELLMLQQVEILLTHVVSSLCFKGSSDVTAIAKHSFPPSYDIIYLLFMAWNCWSSVPRDFVWARFDVHSNNRNISSFYVVL